MKSCCSQMDYGHEPYVANVDQMAERNGNFRKAIWTGDNMQMTLMSIPSGGEIGLEMHADTEQLLRVEAGYGVVKMGECKCRQNFCRHLQKGDVVFVPAGTWHNVINTGGCMLKVSSIYAPPNHPRGTLQRTKEEAEREEY